MNFLFLFFLFFHFDETREKKTVEKVVFRFSRDEKMPL